MTIRSKLIMTASLLAIVCSCSRVTEPQPSIEKEFNTIEQGYHSGHTERKNYVVKDEAAWNTLWVKVIDGRLPIVGPADVDFQKDMLIGVFMGEQSSGGYEIKVSEILERKNTLDVYVAEKQPGPGEGTTTALSQPYHIVRTKTTDKDVKFKNTPW